MLIEPKTTALLLVEGESALRHDYPIAIGALTATGNAILDQVAQRLFEARHMLAALLEVGRRHLDEVHAIVEAKIQPARDEPEGEG